MTSTMAHQTQEIDGIPENDVVPFGWIPAGINCEDKQNCAYSKTLENGLVVVVASLYEAQQVASGETRMEGFAIDKDVIRKAYVKGAFVRDTKPGELVLVERSSGFSAG